MKIYHIIFKGGSEHTMEAYNDADAVRKARELFPDLEVVGYY